MAVVEEVVVTKRVLVRDICKRFKFKESDLGRLVKVGINHAIKSDGVDDKVLFFTFRKGGDD